MTHFIFHYTHWNLNVFFFNRLLNHNFRWWHYMLSGHRLIFLLFSSSLRAELILIKLKVHILWFIINHIVLVLRNSNSSLMSGRLDMLKVIKELLNAHTANWMTLERFRFEDLARYRLVSLILEHVLDKLLLINIALFDTCFILSWILKNCNSFWAIQIYDGYIVNWI